MTRGSRLSFEDINRNARFEALTSPPCTIEALEQSRMGIHKEHTAHSQLQSLPSVTLLRVSSDSENCTSMIRFMERATPPYSREELGQHTHKNHTSYAELQKLTCKRSLSMFCDSRLSPSQRLEKIRTPVSRFKAMTPPPSITIPYSPASIQKRLSVLVC